jgi:hypothetical protein
MSAAALGIQPIPLLPSWAGRPASARTALVAGLLAMESGMNMFEQQVQVRVLVSCWGCNERGANEASQSVCSLLAC